MLIFTKNQHIFDIHCFISRKYNFFFWFHRFGLRQQENIALDLLLGEFWIRRIWHFPSVIIHSNGHICLRQIKHFTPSSLTLLGFSVVFWTEIIDPWQFLNGINSLHGVPESVHVFEVGNIGVLVCMPVEFLCCFVCEQDYFKGL